MKYKEWRNFLKLREIFVDKNQTRNTLVCTERINFLKEREREREKGKVKKRREKIF